MSSTRSPFTGTSTHRATRPLRQRAKTLMVALAIGTLITVSWAPTGAAQIQNPSATTPSTLYFHIFDPFTPFPINTQPMDAAFFEVGGTNFPSVRSQGYAFNTIRGYSTPGPVEYDFIENGRPRFHPERGISTDVNIDSNVQPVVYLYLEVRDLVGLRSAPNALPTFTFDVTLREGDNLRADLDAGPVIMDGSITAHVLDARSCPNDLHESAPECTRHNDAFAGQAGPDGLPILVPDEAGIVEFAIPMELQKNTIPKSEAFNVRIDWYQDPQGAVGEGEFASGYMRLVSDPEHLPRLEMAITNPVFIDFIHPQVAGGVLLIHTGVNSPWGTYDVDVENITISVDGPSSPGTLERVATLNQHVHNHHDEAAEITWLWRFRDEDAKEGEYTISMSVPNLAGNALATGTAGFKIEGKRAFGVADTGEIVQPTEVDEGKETPAPGGPALALGVLAAALLLRLRGRERR